MLTQLTQHNSSAVSNGHGVTIWSAAAAAAVILDRFGRRPFSISVAFARHQASMGLALVLGALILFGVVQLWQVYLSRYCLAARGGRSSSRKIMMGDAELPNAVALNSILYNGVGLIDTGWTFLLNSVSFLAVLVFLSFLCITALTFTNATNRLDAAFYRTGQRGRVMVLSLGVALGGTPIGAPIVGVIADNRPALGAWPWGAADNALDHRATSGAIALRRVETPNARRGLECDSNRRPDGVTIKRTPRAPFHAQRRY